MIPGKELMSPAKRVWVRPRGCRFGIVGTGFGDACAGFGDIATWLGDEEARFGNGAASYCSLLAKEAASSCPMLLKSGLP